jgi:hypothetical protein
MLLSILLWKVSMGRTMLPGQWAALAMSELYRKQPRWQWRPVSLENFLETSQWVMCLDVKLLCGPQCSLVQHTAAEWVVSQFSLYSLTEWCRQGEDISYVFQWSDQHNGWKWMSGWVVRTCSSVSADEWLQYCDQWCFFLICIVGGGIQGPLGTAATKGLFC